MINLDDFYLSKGISWKIYLYKEGHDIKSRCVEVGRTMIIGHDQDY